MEKATFAGGCFWGVEHLFNEIPGVVDAVSGYAGGTRDNPTYEQVSSGRTGHAEAVEVTYDPSKVTYDELLNAFWNMHDPTTLHYQGPDHAQLPGSRPRAPVPLGDLLPQRGAGGSGAPLGRRGPALLQEADRDRDR